MDLDALMTVRVNRGEEEWAKELLSANVPRTREDLRKLVYSLARGNLSVLKIARGKGDERPAKQKLDELLAKLDAIRDAVASSDLAAFPESHRLERVIENYKDSFERYRAGAPWAHVLPDTGLIPATSDERDVRSVYRNVGVDVSKDAIYKIRTPEDKRLVEEYQRYGLLNPDLVGYLEHKIPVATLEYFLSSFSEDEFRTYHQLLTTSALAGTLSADPLNVEYVDVVSDVVRENMALFSLGKLPKDEFEQLYPNLDWGKPQYALKVLMDELHGTMEEKLKIIRAYTNGFKVNLNDIAFLVKTDQTMEKFSSLCEAYKGTFTPEELVRLQANKIDLQTARALYEKLPEIMRFYPVIHTLLIDRKDYDEKKLSEFISYFDHDSPEETFSSMMLHWFFNEYEKAKNDIETLRKAGIRSVYFIYELSSDPRISIPYAAEVFSVVGEEFVASRDVENAIVAWQKAGITKEELEHGAGLWDKAKAVPWYSCDPKSIRAYGRVRSDPDKLQLLEYVCNTYDKVPAEIVADVEHGYSKEAFDAVEKRGLIRSWLDVFTEFPNFVERFDAMSDDEKRGLILLGFDHKLLPAIREDRVDRALEEVASYREEVKVTSDAYAHELTEQSPRHGDYVEYFGLFGISPEYMSEMLARSATQPVLDDSLVNHIILCAYLENKLPPETVVLIERFHISNFTRYPAEVLHRICAGSADEAEDDTIAISISSRSDWNNALDNKSDFLREVSRHHRMYMYEVGDEQEFGRAIEDLGNMLQKKGKRISLLLFDGHGSEELVQLSFPYESGTTLFTKEQVQKLGSMRDYLASDAQLVMASCSAAKGGGDADNIARAFARVWPKVEIFAPTTTTATKGIKFTDDNRVLAVDYTNPNCMEIIRYDPV